MGDQEDLKLLALLVHRGALDRPAAEKLLKEGQATRRKPLELAVANGLFTSERLDFLRRVEGEDVPEVPGFDIVGVAGRGGMAIVLRARDRKAGRDVAIKVLRREFDGDAKAKSAFLREAKLLIGLRHENVVAGEKVGTVHGRLIFLQEFVDGRSLQELLKDGTEFDEDAALYIVLQVARALRYLAQNGVVHRDVKPANVLITARNEVKLIDLGFASSVGDGAQSGGGAPGSATVATDAAAPTTVGTVAYISPEQARGQGDLDVRSDIYSLGATLYQLVVGELPFSGQDNQEILAAQILASLSSEVLKSRKISPHMHYFIEKMMAKEREVRYQTPEELIADIEEQIRGKKTLEFRPEGRDSELLKKPFGAPSAQPRPKVPFARRKRRDER
ncbi:MAG: serine/threonine protein kinase [Planctomycetes bacterium]|nr:serine/threonine protein kinase [Planctomycetota bacterium]